MNKCNRMSIGTAVMAMISTVVSVAIMIALFSPRPAYGNVNDQPGGGCTGCTVSSSISTCSGGNVTLGTAVATAPNCLGDQVTVSLNPTITKGTKTTTSTGVDSCGKPCSTQTQSDDVPTVSLTWQVSGLGATPASGSGPNASFTPNQVGAGTVTFSGSWQDGCGNTHTLQTVTANFTVAQCKKITFIDTIHRDLRSLNFPTLAWNWEATLQAVSATTGEPVCLPITYGFRFDENGNRTAMYFYGSGAANCTGAVVVDGLTDTSYPVVPYTDRIQYEITMQAHYVGPYNGGLNWIQTVTTDSTLPPGDLPLNDRLPGVPPPFYYNPPGVVPYGIDVHDYP